MWERANVYVEIFQDSVTVEENLDAINKKFTPRRRSELSASEQALIPTSAQIKQGLDINNVKVSKYSYQSLITDSTGRLSIVFSDLKPGRQYVICITASSPLFYQPD